MHEPLMTEIGRGGFARTWLLKSLNPWVLSLIQLLKRTKLALYKKLEKLIRKFVTIKS